MERNNFATRLMENNLKSVFFNNRKAEDIGNGLSFLSDQAETDVIS